MQQSFKQARHGPQHWTTGRDWRAQSGAGGFAQSQNTLDRLFRKLLPLAVGAQSTAQQNSNCRRRGSILNLHHGKTTRRSTQKGSAEPELGAQRGAQKTNSAAKTPIAVAGDFAIKSLSWKPHIGAPRTAPQNHSWKHKRTTEKLKLPAPGNLATNSLGRKATDRSPKEAHQNHNRKRNKNHCNTPIANYQGLAGVSLLTLHCGKPQIGAHKKHNKTTIRSTK